MDKKEWIVQQLALVVKQGKVTKLRPLNWWYDRLGQSFDDLPKEPVEEETPVTNEEFISKKVFVDAVYNLTNAEQIAKVLVDKDALKDFLYGFGLFSTEIAPANMFNLLDEHVAGFLQKLNLTVDDIREEIKKQEG